MDHGACMLFACLHLIYHISSRQSQIPGARTSSASKVAAAFASLSKCRGADVTIIRCDDFFELARARVAAGYSLSSCLQMLAHILHIYWHRINLSLLPHQEIQAAATRAKYVRALTSNSNVCICVIPVVLHTARQIQ